MNSCKSCLASLSDSSTYCSSCGAKQVGDRLTMPSLFKVFFVKFTSLDFAFFNTTRWLITDPRRVTIAYIKGVRKKINHPTNYALIIISLYGLFQLVFSDFLDLMTQNNFVSSVREGFNHGMDSDVDEQTAKVTAIFLWLQTRSQFLVFAIIPVLSVFSFLIYKKSRYNLAEHLVIALYAISFSLLINVVIGIFFAPFNTTNAVMLYNSVSSVVAIVAIIWVYQRSLERSVWRIIIALIVSFFLTLCFMTIGAMVVALLF